MVGMVETLTGASSSSAVADAAQLLHDFNVEYDEPAPPPDELAARLAELIAADTSRSWSPARMRLAQRSGSR